MIETLKSRFKWIYLKKIELLSRNFREKTALCWDGGIFDLIMKKTNQYWLADRLSVCRRKVEEFSATAEFQTENTETENLTWDSVNNK